MLMNTGLPSIEYDHIIATATPHIFIHESYARDWRTTHPDVRTCWRLLLSTSILGRILNSKDLDWACLLTNELTVK